MSAMKKLFLYGSLFLAVFIITFYISSKIFSESTKKYNQETSEAQKVINEEFNINTSITTEAKKEEIQIASAMDAIENNRFIVGIKNGYVIVYRNTFEQIYEYTDIDIEKVKVNNIDLYNKLVETIEFDTEDKLFDFLESIAS